MATIKEQRADDQTKMIKAAAERAALIQARRPPPPSPDSSPHLRLPPPHPTPPTPSSPSPQAAKDLERQRGGAPAERSRPTGPPSASSPATTHRGASADRERPGRLRHELELQQQKRLGESQEIGGSRLQLQLEEERRARQQLARARGRRGDAPAGSGVGGGAAEGTPSEARDSDLQAQKVRDGGRAAARARRREGAPARRVPHPNAARARAARRHPEQPRGVGDVAPARSARLRVQNCRRRSSARSRASPANIVSTGGAAAASQVYGGAGDLDVEGVDFSSGEMQETRATRARRRPPPRPEVSALPDHALGELQHRGGGAGGSAVVGARGRGRRLSARASVI